MCRLHFLCKLVHPCPVCLSVQITTIPSAPFRVRGKWSNVLLESNSMSVWRPWGLLSCSQDVPELQAIALHPSPYPSPPKWPSQHSWVLSEMAVKCTVKRRDGEMPLNGNEEAHQPDSTVQCVGLFINAHQCVCHLHSQGVNNKDKHGLWLLQIASGQRWISRQFSRLQQPWACTCSLAVQFQSSLFT